MCGCVCMGVGAYRFVRAMCIVMGVKQWMDGWMDEQRACVGVVRGNKCMHGYYSGRRIWSRRIRFVRACVGVQTQTYDVMCARVI